MTLAIGQLVEWDPVVGGPLRGYVSRIKLGAVYVKSSFANRRGKRMSRVVEHRFEPHEIDMLREVPA